MQARVLFLKFILKFGFALFRVLNVVVIPRVHTADFLADFFELVRSFECSLGIEMRPTVIVLGYPLGSESAVLNFFKNLLHFLFGFVGNSSLARRIPRYRKWNIS